MICMERCPLTSGLQRWEHRHSDMPLLKIHNDEHISYMYTRGQLIDLVLHFGMANEHCAIEFLSNKCRADTARISNYTGVR